MEIDTAKLISPNKTTTWDEQLCIEGCVCNNIIQQEKMYKHFYPAMMAMVLRYTQDRDIAVSILNNGFLRVFKHIKSFEKKGSLEGWIRKIIVHSVSDYFRNKKTIVEIDINTISNTLNNYELPYSKYDYTLLLIALNKLPAATKVVVNLFIIDKYTHKEIATMLGISENTSKWHVAEGRKILFNYLRTFAEK